MKISSGLSEGQVLQRLGKRGADVLLGGECRTEGPIAVSLTQKGVPLNGWKDRPVGSGQDGKFQIRLTNIPVGGPYALKISARGESAAVKAFYVGDVWIMAGQSNMQGYGNMDHPATPHKLARVFTMRREWRQAVEPLHVLNESPDNCHNSGLQASREQAEKFRRECKKGTGVGLFFARLMLDRTGVPQGLIAAAHGGTSMDQWNPAKKKLGGESLYASMCASVEATGQPVAGMLWYQGESDAVIEPAQRYAAAMKRLVAASRKDLRQPKLPWVIVQISRSVRQGDPRGWDLIREHQRKLPALIPQLEVVPSIDLGIDDNVHIGSDSFPLLAERMANAAARVALGSKSELGLPKLKKIHDLKRKGLELSLDLEFSNVKGGLQALGRPSGFSLVNANHGPEPCVFRISLHGNIARLHLSNDTPNDALVGYGLGFDPYCNITDERGFSLPAFGPLNFARSRAILPWVVKWRKTGLLPATRSLGLIGCPDVRKAKHTVVDHTVNRGFVNEFPEWKGQPGQAFFSAVLKLPEAMKLRFLMGYDGPFRLWVNGKSLYQDMEGTNPCIPDEGAGTLSLGRGKHTVTIGMDTNEGRAWGFFLRLERLDVTSAQKHDNSYPRPEYLI